MSLDNCPYVGAPQPHVILDEASRFDYNDVGGELTQEQADAIRDQVTAMLDAQERMRTELQ